MARRRRQSQQRPDGASPPSRDEYERTARFRAALRRFQRISDDVVAEHRLTQRQYELLVLIKGAPGGERATVSELAEGLQLAPNTVTELVRRAELARLLVREANDADGRSVYLRLTAEGERRLAGAVRALDTERRRLAEVVSAAVLDERRP